MILVAWATYLLVGGALKPVERIRSRVASISTKQLDERVPPVPPTGDEIARLAETMNEMLARLESGHLAQRRFVSDASHELRSPLAAISTALELAHARPEMLDLALLDDSLIPEATRMRELIEDLLLLARADEQQLGGRADDVDLDDVLGAEKSRLQGHPGLTVQASISPVRVTGDKRQLVRMVRNLADNAARHAHGVVELQCRREGDNAVITIADDGLGIAPDQRERVFDRFVRLDASRARDAGGSGLGLAIVTEIVAAHRGTVTISDRIGGGACFTVTLPADVDSYVSADPQPVADTAHRVNRVSTEGCVDLSAEVADVDLDDVVIAVVVEVPHRLQDLVLGHHSSGMAHQEFQHAVFAGGRQVQLDGTAADPMARRV